MEVRLLGPVEAWLGDRQVRLGGQRELTVLAALALEVGRPVPVPTLVTALWDDDPPATAHQQVYSSVSKLRRALGDVIEKKPFGYRLVASAAQVDAVRFDERVAEARSTAAHGQTELAVDQLTNALGLWRGPALAGLPGLATKALRLDELRLTALEERIDLELRLGRHTELVAELSGLVAEHSLRERLIGQLMVALYRSGRTADALEVYRLAERRLAADVGVDPGPELQRLLTAVLRADPTLKVATPQPVPPAVTAPVAPAQLPPDVSGFAGREDCLAALTGMLPADSDAGASRSMAVVAIAGTAGVGKSALAVHWGHRVAGRFPDGQLYVNLRGYDPSDSAMSPAEAVRYLLDALAPSPQAIPTDLQAQIGLYRSLLAGRRVLIVLDNARDSEQVRPLLPGTPSCGVVVTSRRQLTSLLAAYGARPLTVDVFSAFEARQMLEYRLGADRVAAEPQAVSDIVASCARLPLALAVVAARAATHPRFPLAALATELREARGGLDAFAGEEAVTDVRAALSWSYHTLGTAAARLFRMLGLHPGPHVTVPAAASLAGVDPASARRLLAELAGAHLMIEQSPGLFTLHDLLRAYAAEQAHAADSAAERQAALHRVLDHYLHTAHRATLLLDPHRDPVTPGRAQPGVTAADLADEQQATAWFAAEHPVLLAAVRRALDAGFDTHTWQLAWTLTTFLNPRGHLRDWAAVQRSALIAARRLGDRSEQARSHRGLARVHGQLGHHDIALDHLQRALELSRDLGDRSAQAEAHRTRGWVLGVEGRHSEARDEASRALDLFRADGNRIGAANALNAIGWQSAHLGDHRQTLTCCWQALTVFEEIGDRYGQANSWDSLGYAHHRLGQYGHAVTCLQQAIQLIRELGYRYDEADLLTHLGDAHHAADYTDAAVEAWSRALDILEGLGHSDAEGVRARLSGASRSPVGSG